jgi:methylase of polypeptide subunit release factors
VDTPPDVVAEVWRQIRKRRKQIDHVVDYGAGDGRFALAGEFKTYTGFEIDPRRCTNASLPENATILNQCAFSAPLLMADVSVGNPPYVCNQDLPIGWRQRASEILQETTGVSLSGLANAWQYFFLWSLATTNNEALCALVIPYEWVSRPSARAIRAFIKEKGWSVSVYRLLDSTFHRVLTTSSITIVERMSHP